MGAQLGAVGQVQVDVHDPPQAAWSARHPGPGGDGATWWAGGRVVGRSGNGVDAQQSTARGNSSMGPSSRRPDTAGGRPSGDLMAYRAGSVAAALLGPGLAGGAGQLEAAGGTGGDPAAGQQVQGRRLLAIQRGTVLLERGHGRVLVAAVVGDRGGGRPRVGTGHRRKAPVAGDGDGAVVGWGGVEQRVPPPSGGVGGGGASGSPAGFAPLSRAGAASERRRVVDLAGGRLSRPLGGRRRHHPPPLRP